LPWKGWIRPRRAPANIYASFVDFAWDEDAGRFRNFMGYDRDWLETEGSQDSFGRGLWALGRTAQATDDHGLKLWATALADKVIPASSFLQSPRAQAFATSGLAAFLAVYPGHRPAQSADGDFLGPPAGTAARQSPGRLDLVRAGAGL
jgi:hypothetical protein